MNAVTLAEKDTILHKSIPYVVASNKRICTIKKLCTMKIYTQTLTLVQEVGSSRPTYRT